MSTVSLLQRWLRRRVIIISSFEYFGAAILIKPRALMFRPLLRQQCGSRHGVLFHSVFLMAAIFVKARLLLSWFTTAFEYAGVDDNLSVISIAAQSSFLFVSHISIISIYNGANHRREMSFAAAVTAFLIIRCCFIRRLKKQHYCFEIETIK